MHARWGDRLDASTIDLLLVSQRYGWGMSIAATLGTIATIVANEAHDGAGGSVFLAALIVLAACARGLVATSRRARNEAARRYRIDPRAARNLSFKGLDEFDRSVARLRGGEECEGGGE